METIPLGLLGPAALAGLAVYLIFTGRLVPRRTYDDKVHEAAEWRTESRLKDQQIAAKDEQIAEKDQQLRLLSEVGTTVNVVLRAIQSRASGGAS